jgi:peroxiredoxin
MATIDLGSSIQPGERAPDFSLPAIERDGMVSLDDYRGKTPLLLGLFRGVYCPLCRRQIARMGLECEKLRAEGVEALAVVSSKLEHARLYFRFHPTAVPLAADPAMTAIRAFGVPRPRVTPELLKAYQSTRVDPNGELPEPVPITEIAAKLNEIDGVEWGPADMENLQQQWGWDTSTQLVGRYLIDRDGVIRWVDLECGEGVAGMGKLSSQEELLAAVRAL